MVRYLSVKRITYGALTLLLLALLLASCTYLPRPEETGTVSDTATETVEDTTSPETEDADSGEVQTDANGFPNEPEDGHTKRY